jgi:hypothetical protein
MKRSLPWKVRRMPSRQDRKRPEKIIVAMFRLSKGTTGSIKYEDVVVEAFRLFPDEFALRGYPQYPDSSDVHKPLYGVLKQRGLVRSGNKTFALTSQGVELAKSLIEAAGDRLEEGRKSDRMTRDIESEVARMLNSDAFHLFVNDQGETIVDTDFYSFVGCTVRTSKNDFIGRLSATSSAVKKARELEQPDLDTAEDLSATWAFLQSRFEKIIITRR